MGDDHIHKLQYFSDLEASLSLGKNRADQRIQVKMPKNVVSELDRLFPHTDRSFLLTQLATHAINTQLRYADRAILRQQKESEQMGLDDMLNYLEDRDAEIVN
jgi:hypothetical protein